MCVCVFVFFVLVLFVWVIVCVCERERGAWDIVQWMCACVCYMCLCLCCYVYEPVYVIVSACYVCLWEEEREMHGTGLCNECITTTTTMATWDRASFRFQLSWAKLLDLKRRFFRHFLPNLSSTFQCGRFICFNLSTLCLLSSWQWPLTTLCIMIVNIIHPPPQDHHLCHLNVL